MTFSSVYPHYVAKVEKKGRTKEDISTRQMQLELYRVLTKGIAAMIQSKATFLKTSLKSAKPASRRD